MPLKVNDLRDGSIVLTVLAWAYVSFWQMQLACSGCCASMYCTVMHIQEHQNVPHLAPNRSKLVAKEMRSSVTLCKLQPAVI